MSAAAARPRGPGGGLAWLGFAAPALASWLLWWAALYPGLVSFDPLYEWEGIQAGTLYDWHPFLHALLLRALARPGDPFGALTLLHVVATAALVGLALSRARRLGAPLALTVAAALAFAVLPTYASQVIAAWKDTTFGVAFLAAMVVLLDGLAAGRLGPWRALLLGLACAVVALLRHPGIVLALALLGGAAALFPAERRAVAVATALCLLLFGGVRGPLRRALHVVPAPNLLVYHSVLHDLAAHVAAGTPLPPGAAAVLSSMLPLDAWRARYDCSTSAPLIFDPAFRRDALDAHVPEVRRLWVQLAEKRPGTLARHRACATAFIWAPGALVAIGPFDGDGHTVDANRWGIANRPLLPTLGAILAQAKARVENSRYRRVVNAPATFLYALLGAAALGYARTRGRVHLVVAAAALVNTATYLALSSSPEVRFQWPVLLLAPLAVLLTAADLARARARGTATARLHAVPSPPEPG